jgi:hypothetical protein
MQALPALCSTDFPFKAEAPVIIITTMASGTPRRGSGVRRNGRRPASSFKADENLILPERRSGSEHHEREINPEGTPMTMGGSLAARSVESTRGCQCTTDTNGEMEAIRESERRPEMTT